MECQTMEHTLESILCLMNIFQKMLSNYEVFHADPKEFLTIDNKVIVFGLNVGKSKHETLLSYPFIMYIKL